MARWLPALGLIFNAFTWGVSWWPFRQFQSLGLHPLWITTFMYTVAALGLALARPQALAELLRTPTLWVLVLASGTTNAAFNWAVTIGDVVRVVLLFYLMPLWAVLLARPLLGERISARAMFRVALALGGAAVVLWPAGGGWPMPRSLPDLLGIVGGFSFALNNVMLKHEAARSDTGRALAMFSGGALVSGVLAFALWSGGQAPAPPAPGWGWMLAALAMSAWFLASNLTLQYGAARLPANTTAVIMITEVFFASASAIALGAGVLTVQAALGGVLILGAAALASLQRD